MMLYEIRAPQGQFALNLYKNYSDNNVLNKYIVSVGVLYGTLRDECNILTPTLLLEMESIPVFNYVYLDIFNRYYYVTRIDSVRNNLWRISLKVDVLMSYKDILLDTGMWISRNENRYNPLIYDTLVPFVNQPQYVNYGLSPDLAYNPMQPVASGEASTVINVLEESE